MLKVHAGQVFKLDLISLIFFISETYFLFFLHYIIYGNIFKYFHTIYPVPGETNIITAVDDRYDFL